MNKFILIFACLFYFSCEAKLPIITKNEVTQKRNEMLAAHASHKKLDTELSKRLLLNYVENLDPNKTYFIQEEIQDWLEPSNELLDQVQKEYDKSIFSTFDKIDAKFIASIYRHRLIESENAKQPLPTNVKVDEFKNMKWALNEQELTTRLARIKGLQAETAAKLSEDMKEKAIQSLSKIQAKHEEDYLNPKNEDKERLQLSNILKATASSLDAHTVYFNPGEASQFIINVQKRLFGIGAQLRDDLNGLKVVKLVEGGPAIVGKQLKENDRIIAVNGEPIVGMDISDAVELIRGEAGTAVTLTVIREKVEGKPQKTEEKLDLTILRGEVVFKDARYKSDYQPYGNGIIGYIKLHSFYQDPETSSTQDLEREINELKHNHHLNGLILDLRYNSGGLLPEAVGVAGLFISKGIVVSIKDEKGRIQHLRDIDGTTAWDGPLIILVNRMSASASEIVAQALQDYGRAIIVGDDRTFGKGSYQTFTLSTTSDDEHVNPLGEYKVTRGRYYTVSGKTPQLNGVLSDIIVPGLLSESEVGERYATYPLDNDQIKPNFDDDLTDLPFLKRDQARKIYHFDLQERMSTYNAYINQLKNNSTTRLNSSQNYQNFLTIIKEKDEDNLQLEVGQNDLQLDETYAIMKDLILLMKEQGHPVTA